MEHCFDKSDALNDVIRLKTKHKQLASQVKKARERDYECMLQLVLAKANEMYAHPKRKRDNVTIIDIDPQYGLFLGGLKEHAKSYAVEGENENGEPVYVKYEAKSGSKVESGHEERRRKTKHCDERLDNHHVGRARRGEKDKVKNVARDDRDENERLYQELDRRINCPTQNRNVGADQDRIFNRPTQIWNVGVNQDRVISHPTQNWNSGIDQDRIFNRPTQNRDVGVDQDRIFNRLTQNRNVCVDEDRAVNLPTQNRNVVVDQDQVISRPTQNRNMGVDQDRVISCPTQNLNLGVDQDRPVSKNKSRRHGKVKWKDMVDGDDEDTKPTFWVNYETLVRKNGLGNNRANGDYRKHVDHGRPSKKKKVQGDNGLLRQKTDLRECAVKDRLVRKVKAQSSRKRAHCDADVEILDGDAFHQNLSSSVPSNTYHKSMGDDIVDCHHFGSTSSAADVFRKRLVDVLKKPFDKDELKRLRDYVRDGSYYYYYPDLESKLRKYRYKRGKLLNIFRGFLFWLQNVSQQGAFKPWKDGRCIAVEPGPPQNSPPPHFANPNREEQSKTQESEVNLCKGVCGVDILFPKHHTSKIIKILSFNTSYNF